MEDKEQAFDCQELVVEAVDCGNITMSKNIDKIAPALVNAMGNIGVATRDKENPFFKSTYSTLESVIMASKAQLLENDLGVLQSGGELVNKTMTLETLIFHSSGQWFRTKISSVLNKFSPQDIGSAITYLCRYGRQAALGIPSSDDDGSDASLPSVEQTDALDILLGYLTEWADIGDREKLLSKYSEFKGEITSLTEGQQNIFKSEFTKILPKAEG